MTKLFYLSCCLLGIVSISSCSTENPVVLQLGTNVWPGYEPLYMARELGYLDGNKVRLVEYSSASQVLQSYRNGLIDAAALTLDEVMLLLSTGETPKIVLVTDISHGADVIIGQPDIKKLADIRGKRVAIEGTALGAFMIVRALEIAGIEHETVEIINRSVDEHEDSFLTKEVDAVVTFEPVRSKLLASGGNPLFDSRDIKGEVIDVVVVRDSFLQNHPKTVQHVLSAWYRSIEDFKHSPEESAKILGQRMKLDGTRTLAAYDGLILPDQKSNENLLHASPAPPILTTLRRLSQFMLDHKLIGKPVDVETLLDISGKYQANFTVMQ